MSPVTSHGVVSPQWYRESGGGRRIDGYLAGGTKAYMWWDRSADNAIDELQERLVALRGVLREHSDKNRRPGAIDVTLENFRNNIPVTPKWF